VKDCVVCMLFDFIVIFSLYCKGLVQRKFTLCRVEISDEWVLIVDF
jgi:hypothetical protein